MTTRTAGQAMATAAGILRAAGVPDPARDARVLLGFAAQVDASRVTLIAPDPLDPQVSDRYDELIALRARRVPVSHIIGEREFYGRRFKVSGDVLDPRPETEALIETALAEPFDRVLDLGTGSGCIIVTLLAERPTARGVAGDLSEAACLQASQNAVLNGVQSRLSVVQSDWLAAIDGQFDLIVSNPPYIALSEMDGLSEEVRGHEPHMALTDFGDGLSAYRSLAQSAPAALSSQGRLIVEIGPTQGSAVAQMFEKAGLIDVQVIADLDGRDRVVLGRKVSY